MVKECGKVIIKLINFKLGFWNWLKFFKVFLGWKYIIYYVWEIFIILFVLIYIIYWWIRNNGDSILFKYKYVIEYIDDYDEVILDLEKEKIFKNGYFISNLLGFDIFSDFDSIKEEIE